MNLEVRDMIKERQAQDDEILRSMEKHPRCALLPSPEKLDEWIGSPGSDRTDTLGDFELVKDFLTERKFLNTCFDSSSSGGEKREQLENDSFYNAIRLAWSNAFAAIRNTASPELPELVFWYYTGHGLGEKTAEELCYSSTPCLDKLLDVNFNDVANDFVKEGRKVKGGELCLHKVGFCDLYGLLKPWIAAVKSKSINAEGIKKNKHLVIILDSCHSGMIAKELNDFKRETDEKDPTFLVENSVTIQAACGPDERTFGGYFTPCFVYLNDPKNEKLLSELKDEWEKMSEESREWYRSIDLPSPMVVTTEDEPTDVTMERTVQNVKLTLFPNPGFFKFCSDKVFHHQQEGMIPLKDRVLNSTSATTFMSSASFIVLDYKLKTYKGTGPADPHAGTPFGLFLLEDKSGHAVCAHIHFKKGDTQIAQRINLVKHKKPPMGCIFYVEDHDGLSSYEISHNKHKIQVPLDSNAERLKQACCNYVNSKEPDRWEDDSKWNMRADEFGVSRMFRGQECSAWEGSYLKYIEKYKLRKVCNKGCMYCFSLVPNV